MKDLKIDPKKTEKQLEKFIREQAREAGFRRGMIGLSGGVDSSVIACLASKALGPKNVWGIMLPYKTSSEESVEHAEMMVEKLGINSEMIEITPMVDAYFKQFPEAPGLRRGNKMARERMSVLFDLSAKLEALVIGSANKSEILLGYGTLYGDTACAMMPLGGLYKTQVWQLAQYLGVPGEIVNKPPTADLWPGQTDEGEFGFTYKEADALLHRMVDCKKTPKQLKAEGFDERFIRKVAERVEKNAFKRRLPAIPAT